MSKIRILLLILGLLAVTGAPTLGHAKTMRPEEGTSESEKMPEKGETPPATPAQPEAENPESKASPFGQVQNTPLAPIALSPGEDKDHTVYLQSTFSNPRFDSLVAEGFSNFAGGQAIQAIDFLQKAVVQGSKSPLVYMKLALAYEYLGNPYTAIQYYGMAEPDIATLPEDHLYRQRFHEFFARALLSHNQRDAAIPHLEAAAPTSDQYWLLSQLADHYLEKGELEKALPQLLRAVEVPSIQDVAPADIASVYLAIGKIYLSQNNLDEAHRYLDYATRTDPQNREAGDLKHKLVEQKQKELYQQNMGNIMDQMK